ncbi:MAG: glycosyltransferase family 4 protein [Hyphomicrobiaceae bacterium]
MRGRVHFVNRYFAPDQSATSQILTGVANDLARRGYDVMVTASRQLYEDPKSQLARDQVVGRVKVHRVRTTCYGRRGLIGRLLDYCCFYLGAAKQVWKVTRPGDVVIAKTDPPLLSLIIAPIARLRGAIYVNWLQDVFPEVAGAVNLGGRAGHLAWPALRWGRNLSLRLADTNVAIGERMAEFLEAQGIGGDRIDVIQNWADQGHEAPSKAAVADLRRAWGLDGKFVVGYAGNLGRVHEIDTVLDAMERLQTMAANDANARDLTFLFVGGGAKRAYFEAEMVRRGLTNVVLKPYQPADELGATLAVADVHLVTLLPELEGLVVPCKFYGIAAAGRPTVFVGSEHGEIARLIRRHDCGRAVGVGQSEALANTLLSLSRDPASVLSLGRHARAAFAAFFDKSFAVQQWAHLIDTLQAAPVASPAAAEPVAAGETAPHVAPVRPGAGELAA